MFSDQDKIDLDANSIAYVVGELQTYSVLQADRDAIGEAFEIFIGPALRGAEGQFFTPRNVVRGLVEMVDPQPGEMIIDPACGSGGFLTAALEHVWRSLEAEGERKAWAPTLLERRKRDVATRTLRGLDKDAFLARCTKAYMAVLGDGRGGVVRVDSSLQPCDDWAVQVQDKVKLNMFDVVLTNPPFGKKIRVTGRATLEQYDLGHAWATNKETGEKQPTDKVQYDQAPQLLFVERCLQLLKPGGRLGIILPESLFGSPSYSHIVKWLEKQAAILAVAAMPEPLFKTSGKAGTHTKVCMVVMRKRPFPGDEEFIFMADAKWCGHDSRGNPTLRKDGDREILLDDVPVIAQNYVSFKNSGLMPRGHLGFMQARTKIVNTILVPKYYDPELAARIWDLESTHEMPELGKFIQSGAVAVTTGIEVGKMAYGTGSVPFIRTSNLSNWELRADPKHGVSVELYEALKRQQPDRFEVRAGDILMVRDGTYLIGTSAVISSRDTQILYQSHVMKIRVNDETTVDPWLLFAALNSPIVKRQIRAKRFTQDIIDSLGNRLAEVRVPLPLDAGLPTWSHTVRLVAEHAALRGAIGDTPSVHAAYRFTVKLREHGDMLTACTDRVLTALRDRLPGMGSDLALDGSDLPAYANGMRDLPNGKPRERYADPDASWGHRSAISTRKGGGFYGYKVHAAVCTHTGLPVAWQVQSAAESEYEHMPSLLDTALRRGFTPGTCVLDKGYDGSGMYAACESHDIRPVIPLKKTLNVVNGMHKPPSCQHGVWTFAGSDTKRGASKWRCPTGGCQPGSVWIKARTAPLAA